MCSSEVIRGKRKFTKQNYTKYEVLHLKIKLNRNVLHTICTRWEKKWIFESLITALWLIVCNCVKCIEHISYMRVCAEQNVMSVCVRAFPLDLFRNFCFYVICSIEAIKTENFSVYLKCTLLGFRLSECFFKRCIKFLPLIHLATIERFNWLNEPPHMDQNGH